MPFTFDLPTVRPPVPDQPRCGLCKLYQDCQSPKMRPRLGTGKRVLVIGDAPESEDDSVGTPFAAGRAARRLRQAVKRAGHDLDDLSTAYALACHPRHGRAATDEEVEHCRPSVISAVKAADPETIILTGRAAVRSVVGWLWQDNPGGAARWAGHQIPDRRWNVWVCPTYSPKWVLREEERNPVVGRIFDQHIREALSLTGRPHLDPVAKDMTGRCRIETDPDLAAEALLTFRQDKMWAFDYETNCRKPDRPEARIASIAIATPERAVAAPWVGPVKDAVKELLAGPARKVAHNLKFEIRWSVANGMKVKNAWHDTMICAKFLDLRKAGAGLDYRAYAHFGHPIWDDDVAEYLKSEKGGKHGANGLNRVFDCPLDKLLTYGAVDALLEAKLAVLQTSLLPEG